MPLSEEDKLLASRYIDGELDGSALRDFESKLNASRDLSDYVEDLRWVLTSTQQHLPEPSSAAYFKSVGKLRGAYGRHRKPSRLWGWVLASTALAAAALLLFVRPVETKPQPLKSIKHDIEQTALAYQDAIASLEILANKRIKRMPAEMASVMEKNLEIINAAIAECESLVRKDPFDYNAHASLAKSYRAKADLLEKILES